MTKLSSYKRFTLWPVFSKYIKVRDADQDGWVTCCTCPKRFRWDDSSLNAGHFVPGHNNTTYFDETIVHGQCADCNCAGSGEQYAYGRFMKERYGHSEAQLDDIRALRYKTKKVTLEELKELKVYFYAEFLRIKSEKGL